MSSFITSKDLKNIREYNRLVSEEGVSSQTAWYRTMNTSSQTAKELFNDEENLTKVGKSVILSEKAIADASNNLTIGARAAKLGLDALSMAGNMILITLISKGIELAIKAIDDSIHHIENIKKKAEEAKSSINDIRDSFKSNSSTVNEAKERYAELAQSVENLGKANQSRGELSNDDYAEFLDLSNQLADAFPQLTKGYDDNGNAILNLSGNVDTIVGSLENLLKVQQKLAQQEILEKMPDAWDGYLVDLEDYNKELDTSQKKVDGFEASVSKLDYGKFQIKKSDPFNSIIGEALKEALDVDYHNNGKLYQENYKKNKNKRVATWDFSALSEEDFEKLKAKIGELGAKYEDEVKLTKDKISAANNDMSSYISSWLSQDFQFTTLQKESPDLANGISEFLLNGDWASNLPEEAGKTWEEVSKWINNQFLYAIRKAQENKNISKAITEVFSNQDLTTEEKLNYLNQITDYGKNIISCYYMSVLSKIALISKNLLKIKL